MMVFRKVAPMKYNMCCSLCPVFVLYLLVATSSLVVVCNNDIVKRFNTVLQWLVLFLLNYVYSIKLCVSVSVVPQSVTILRPNVFRERFFFVESDCYEEQIPGMAYSQAAEDYLLSRSIFCLLLFFLCNLTSLVLFSFLYRPYKFVESPRPD